MKGVLLFCLINFAFVLANDEATVSSDEDISASVTSVKLEDDKSKGSPSVSALLAFIDPPYGLYSSRRQIDLPAGRQSSIIVSIANEIPAPSEQRFSLDLIEGSLHYPLYYSYIIQNITKQRLHNNIEAGQQASILYKFKPAVELAGQPFDLSITLYYHDSNGEYYSHSLFNQTVSLYEVDEGMDTEMIFLFILVVALSIAVLIGIWHWCSSKSQIRQPNQRSKFSEVDNELTTENEYLKLINNSKSSVSLKGRSSQTVHRRQGKR